MQYYGTLLSIIHSPSQFKLLIFVIIFSLLYLPINLPLPLEVLLTAGAISVMETLNNKMRLFKVRVYLAAAAIMMLLAIVAQ